MAIAGAELLLLLLLTLLLTVLLIVFSKDQSQIQNSAQQFGAPQQLWITLDAV